jgi:hypothetical protein
MDSPQHTQLSLHQRAWLRACGYPISAPDTSPPDPVEATQLALDILESPSPRMVTAAACALLYAAKAGLREPPMTRCAPAALRRAGFLLDSLAHDDGLPQEVQETLRVLTARIRQRVSPIDAPLPLSLGMSRGLARRLLQDPSPRAASWQIVGRPELPSSPQTS